MDKIIFMSVKQDILEIIRRPLVKYCKIITYCCLSFLLNSKKVVKEVLKLLSECGTPTFVDFPQLFPTASSIISQLHEYNIIIQDRNVRSTSNQELEENSSLQGFRLMLPNAIEKRKIRQLLY